MRELVSLRVEICDCRRREFEAKSVQLPQQICIGLFQVPDHGAMLIEGNQTPEKRAFRVKYWRSLGTEIDRLNYRESLGEKVRARRGWDSYPVRSLVISRRDHEPKLMAKDKERGLTDGIAAPKTPGNPEVPEELICVMGAPCDDIVHSVHRTDRPSRDIKLEHIQVQVALSRLTSENAHS
jgi:hypothetical protein